MIPSISSGYDIRHLDALQNFLSLLISREYRSITVLVRPASTLTGSYMGFSEAQHGTHALHGAKCLQPVEDIVEYDVAALKMIVL